MSKVRRGRRLLARRMGSHDGETEPRMKPRSSVTTALLLDTLAALAPSPRAAAAPTGLAIIPTADLLPPGVASLEVETVGNRALPGGEGETPALSQFGLTTRLDAGSDRRIGGGPGHTLLNAKWLVLPEERGLPAIAVGVQNVAGGLRAEPYLVGTRSLGQTRFHLGALRTEGALRPLAGIDHTLGTLMLMAEVLGGPEGVAAGGIALPLTSRLGLTYAATLPTRGGQVGHIVNLALLVGKAP